MTEQNFIDHLQERIALRVQEWRRTRNPRRRQILKHEIWTLESVLREYTSIAPEHPVHVGAERTAAAAAVH